MKAQNQYKDESEEQDDKKRCQDDRSQHSSSSHQPSDSQVAELNNREDLAGNTEGKNTISLSY